MSNEREEVKSGRKGFLKKKISDVYKPTEETDVNGQTGKQGGINKGLFFSPLLASLKKLLMRQCLLPGRHNFWSRLDPSL